MKSRTDKIIDKDPFNDRDFVKDFRSIRKIGGLSVREELSEKNLGK